ncbi:FGGY-family carbohydrate kinase [Sciscionella marina]|uniref:FGGY-family carbohydrate kinase n=1 Tax=Sciscionella marina TaxID=508770 RepID=UPI000370A00C|nr:FGGY family carbohydrate kinase [Sciscionella marina]
MIWLGVDLGTQSARAVAVDEDGTQLAVGSAPLHGEREGARHVQDPAHWRAGARTALRALAGELSPAQRSAVGGIAVDSTSGTFTILGADGDPRSPGLMYDDNRAADRVGAVREAGSALWEKLGYTASPSWALTKLSGMALTDPDLLATRGNRLAHQADVVTGMLTGNPWVATDSSHALKSGFDIVHLSWPHTLFDRLGIPEAVLPDVVTPGTRIGELCAGEADEIGLPQGIPVFAGMTDGCAAQLGSGALAPGDWNSVLGTTLVLKGVSTELRGEPTGAVYSHRGPEPGTWLPGGASGAGAGVLSELFAGAELNSLTAQAESAEPLDCYPLAAPGERFPFIAPEAYGFLGDRSLDAQAVTEFGAARVFSSVLHAVAFAERLCFELLAIAGFPVHGRIRIGGGGTKNEWWNQLRADVLGRGLERTVNTETGAGMAVLAAWAAGDRGLAEVAETMSGVARVYEPGGDRHDDQYAAFRAALQNRGWLRS